jgi:hypothetical protein
MLIVRKKVGMLSVESLYRYTTIFAMDSCLRWPQLRSQILLIYAYVTVKDGIIVNPGTYAPNLGFIKQYWEKPENKKTVKAIKCFFFYNWKIDKNVQSIITYMQNIEKGNLAIDSFKPGMAFWGGLPTLVKPTSYA